MPPRKSKTKDSLLDLFGLATESINNSIHKPNILAFGQKKYPEQERFHRSLKRGRFISGGNRGGKTDAAVVDAIWTATDTHPYRQRPSAWGHGAVELRFVVADVSKGVEQTILPKLQRWMTSSMLIDGSWDRSWDTKNMILTLSNGSTIDFVTWGMELSKLGGVPRHGIYFDEEPPQHIFNESIMRLVDYKGYWVIAATPTKGMGWTYDLLWEPAISARAQGNVDFPIDTFELDISKNPYIEADESDMDFYTMAMDKEERDIREHGSFVARSGLVFPDFALHTEQYVSKEAWMPPKSWRWYTSVDVGWNNPTAWLWHAVSPQGDIYTFAEHYANHMTVSEHSAVVLAREAGWGKHADMRTGDPAMKQTSQITGTNIIQEYGKCGIHLAVDMVPHDVAIGVEKMQAYFRILPRGEGKKSRPTWIISPNCVNLIRELKRLRWATYQSEKIAYETNKREEIHKKDDHAFDSARYFATLMPDLRPQIPDEMNPMDKIPTTISYTEMMARLRADPTITFVEDTAEEPEFSLIGYGD